MALPTLPGNFSIALYSDWLDVDFDDSLQNVDCNDPSQQVDDLAQRFFGDLTPLHYEQSPDDRASIQPIYNTNPTNGIEWTSKEFELLIGAIRYWSHQESIITKRVNHSRFRFALALYERNKDRDDPNRSLESFSQKWREVAKIVDHPVQAALYFGRRRINYKVLQKQIEENSASIQSQCAELFRKTCEIARPLTVWSDEEINRMAEVIVYQKELQKIYQHKLQEAHQTKLCIRPRLAERYLQYYGHPQRTTESYKHKCYLIDRCPNYTRILLTAKTRLTEARPILQRLSQDLLPERLSLN